MQRQILRLSTPNILSNIVIPLVGMVDVAIMGHLGSDIYIGAVALGAMIFNFLYWGFGFAPPVSLPRLTALKVVRR